MRRTVHFTTVPLSARTPDIWAMFQEGTFESKEAEAARREAEAAAAAAEEKAQAAAAAAAEKAAAAAKARLKVDLAAVKKEQMALAREETELLRQQVRTRKNIESKTSALVDVVGLFESVTPLIASVPSGEVTGEVTVHAMGGCVSAAVGAGGGGGGAEKAAATTEGAPPPEK